MNKKLWTLAAAGSLTALMSAGALAQPPGAPGEPTPGREHPNPFEKMDADGDGKVTFAEASAVQQDLTQARFTEMDSNGDGVWTLLPRGDRRGPGGPGGPRGPRPNPDTDGDGKVTAAEFAAAMPDAPADLFSRLDANSDGVLTEDERPMGPPPGGPGRGPDGPRGEHGDRGAKMRAADTNEDGQITYEEAAAQDNTLTQETFKARDRNGDGVWSRADRPEGGPGRKFGPPVE